MKVARIGGVPTLLVSPWAALGTNVLGAGLASIAYFSTKSTGLKIISFFGGAWMLTAAAVEIAKLIEESKGGQ